MKPQSRFYLPALDGLRFFAFLAVFIHHFPAISTRRFSLINQLSSTLVNFGWMGVDLFLCLSAYLLTSLILLEYQATQQFKIKDFFIRRALRIWPLYYLMLFLAFILFPLINKASQINLLTQAWGSDWHISLLKIHLLPYLGFLGNFSYAYSPPPSTLLAPLWTISLEEQFYLFCPILFYVLLSKNKKYLISIAFLGLTVAFLSRFYIIINEIHYPAIWVFTLGRIDPFILGGALAFFHLQSKKKKQLGKFSFVAAFFILFSLIFCINLLHLNPLGLTGKIAILTLFLSALISTLLIHSILNIPLLNSFFSLSWLRWLGKISFGLYAYHDFVIQRVLLNMNMSTLGSSWEWLFYFLLSFAITVLCAAISYYTFEKYFLTLKEKFTRIKSRPI